MSGVQYWGCSQTKNNTKAFTGKDGKPYHRINKEWECRFSVASNEAKNEENEDEEKTLQAQEKQLLTNEEEEDGDASMVSLMESWRSFCSKNK